MNEWGFGEVLIWIVQVLVGCGVGVWVCCKVFGECFRKAQARQRQEWEEMGEAFERGRRRVP